MELNQQFPGTEKDLRGNKNFFGQEDFFSFLNDFATLTDLFRVCIKNKNLMRGLVRLGGEKNFNSRKIASCVVDNVRELGS